MRQNDNCPHCGHHIDSHSLGESAMPIPGNLSVCLYCSSLSVFDEKLKLRKPTAAEVEEYKADADLWLKIKNYIAVVKEVNKPE